MNARKSMYSLFVAISASMTVTLYPMIMFLINNQGEFWFTIGCLYILMLILTLTARNMKTKKI